MGKQLALHMTPHNGCSNGELKDCAPSLMCFATVEITHAGDTCQPFMLMS